MTHHHDDEAVHWRARVDAIPDRSVEATPERAMMSEADIQSTQRSLDVFRRGGFVPTSFLAEMAYNAITEVVRLRAVIAERDREVERLRDKLEQIETVSRNALTRPLSALRVIEEHAREALGEAAPELARRADGGEEG